MRAGELSAALHFQTPQAQGLTSLSSPACALALPMQVAAEQGGQAQSSSCTKDMPADEPATSQAQALSQGLLAGPVQRSEQHQGLGRLAAPRAGGLAGPGPPLPGKGLEGGERLAQPPLRP